MNTNNLKKASIVLIVYLIVTLTLLYLGYYVRKPEVAKHGFPFSITYSYQGETKTISGVYVGEHVRGAKRLGDDAVIWHGYIQDHSKLESDYFRIAEVDEQLFSIDLNMEPGYLMGDPKYADSVCQPTGACHSSDGTKDITITDPAELAELGFSIVSWEYPKPIENTFSFDGLSLSGETTMYTVVIALAALLACLILIKRSKETAYGMMDKISIGLNFLIAFAAFPFILMVSMLSEIVADTSVWQQALYCAPALTILGIGTSVTMRRLGYKHIGFWSQFAGPVVFALLVLIVNP